MAHLSDPSKKRPIADINVVPFIDVMLVLLVIFMITAPLLTQGVKVDLPKTEAQAIDDHKEPLIITVNASGQYFFNLAEKPTQSLNQQALSRLVAAELRTSANNGNRSVLVRGDKNVQYGKIIEAMVVLQHAGAKSVGLITEPSDIKK